MQHLVATGIIHVAAVKVHEGYRHPRHPRSCGEGPRRLSRDDHGVSSTWGKVRKANATGIATQGRGKVRKANATGIATQGRGKVRKANATGIATWAFYLTRANCKIPF